MPNLRLSPSATVTETAAGVLLRSDLGTFRLDGDDVRVFLNELVPLLDGTRDRDTLARELAGYAPASVAALLDVLEERGLVESAPSGEEGAASERRRGEDDFFRRFETPGRERLAQARIAFVGLEPWAEVAAERVTASGLGALDLIDDAADRGDRLASRLAPIAPETAVIVAGTARLEDLPPPDLLVVGAPGDDVPLLERTARYAHGHGVRSLYAHLDGLDAVVGPAVHPGETACWKCTRLRLLAAAADQETAHAIEHALADERPAQRRRMYLAPMPSLLGDLIALEAIKLVTRYAPSELLGRQLVQNLVSLETTRHTVVRMPWCPICGGARATRRESSDDPEGEQPGLDADCTEEELRERLDGWVDLRTGIVRFATVISPDVRDPDFPTTASALLASYTEGAYHPAEPEVGSGKGRTTTEALIGAVGEAIERYSAARYWREDLTRSSRADLDGDVLEPSLVALYADDQYAERGFPFARVTPELELDWVRGRWLDGGAVWVPALPAFFNFRVPSEEYFCQVSSNGLAAGPTIDAAELRAVYELLERDAFMLTWLARRPAPRLELDEPVEPEIAESIRQLEQGGATVELRLVREGVGIPVVAAAALGDGERWPAATFALAGAPDLRTALRRAVFELGHVAPYIRRLMRDEEHPVPAEPRDVRALLDHALYYAPTERLSALEFLDSEKPLALSATAAEPLTRDDLCGLLRAGGVRVAVVDVTSPDLRTSPFRVARAVGEYIQPIDFGFALARLGNPRLQRLLVDGVNPHPHPIA